MKIVCPSCEAAYEVPEVVLTSRRKMRCARCAHDWVPGAPRAPAPEAPPPVAAPAQVEVPAMAAASAEREAAEPEPAAAPVAPVYEPPVTAEPVAEDEPDIEPPQDLQQYLVVRPDTPVVMFPDEILPPRPASIPPKVLVVPPAAQGQPWAAWAGSIGLLVVLVAGALMFRGPVMKLWPPSVRVYTALGLSQ